MHDTYYAVFRAFALFWYTWSIVLYVILVKGNDLDS